VASAVRSAWPRIPRSSRWPVGRPADHLPAKLPKDATVFSGDTSILFKETRVVRMWDEANRTLVYLAISRKLIDGAPANSISTVPVMPWGGR
jgi:CreA protein